MITAFVVFPTINAQTVPATTRITNNTNPIIVSNPSVTNGTIRPNPIVPVFNGTASGNISAPTIN